MATFEATTHPTVFSHMEGGTKTVYVVPWSMEYSMMSSGDRIEFDDLGSISIGMIRKYDTLSDLLEAEGPSNVVPEADSVEKATDAIEVDGMWRGADLSHGVLALRVRWAKRKS
jgi:ASC-1-like (ASCH) protein